MTDTNHIKQLLDDNEDKREFLFARGFYLTNKAIDANAYPFFGIWRYEEIGPFKLLVHSKQKLTICNRGGQMMVLIGHAYDPIRMISEEAEILEMINKDLYGEINNLTGIFTLFIIKDNIVTVYGDPTGMQTVFYSCHDGVQISSHTNLLGDINEYHWDEYAKSLVEYRFFHMLGNSMPGDITQFKEVKRLTPNHKLVITDGKIEVKRFYWPSKHNLTKEEICNTVAELLRNNLALIAKKWHKPAISLTGGCDSKTTLACANGLYDEFQYFSYISSPQEAPDAEAAKDIAHSLKLQHEIHFIPDRDEQFKDIEITRDILYHNTGSICDNNANDVRKRCYYANNNHFDIEVKSWASEIGRAYYSKRFNNRIHFGSKPTPRKLTTMYKFFLHNRSLVRNTDKVFKSYLDNYFEQAENNPIDWQEQIFWEFRCASWNGLVITGEHRYSFDITIPYNNRILLELLLSVPVKDRINDTIYKMVREKMNPKVDECGIAVTNVMHTHWRAIFEGIYYTLHSKFPF